MHYDQPVLHIYVKEQVAIISHNLLIINNLVPGGGGRIAGPY